MSSVFDCLDESTHAFVSYRGSDEPQGSAVHTERVHCCANSKYTHFLVDAKVPNAFVPILGEFLNIN